MDYKNYNFLKNYPLFGGLTETQIKKIIPFLKKEIYKKDQIILKEGEDNSKIYFIVKGKVEIFKSIKKNGKAVKEILAILKKGDNFGEMELIEIKKVIASVKALEDTEVLTFTNRELLKLEKIDLSLFSMLILNLARELSRRLEKMDDVYAQLLLKYKEKI